MSEAISANIMTAHTLNSRSNAVLYIMVNPVTRNVVMVTDISTLLTFNLVR